MVPIWGLFLFTLFCRVSVLIVLGRGVIRPWVMGDRPDKNGRGEIKHRKCEKKTQT